MGSYPWMHVIAVTGGLGSGKSACVSFFKKIGAYTVSADELAREAVKPGTLGLSNIIKEFGKEVLSGNGALDRKKLGAIVFTDSKQRKKLEQILHPIIEKMAEENFKAGLEQGEKFLIYDCPLLFEAGLEKRGFKKIIVVTAPTELCIERVIRRDGISREEAQKRLASQMPLSEKEKRADIVINNLGSLKDLEKKVKDIDSST